MEGVEVPEYTAQKEVKVTKDGGKIVLSRDKDENTYLAVQFINDTVYLNVEDGADVNQPGADLRVVEVPEESDAAWGTLVGYGTDAEDGSYDMNVHPVNAIAFVNSNQTRRIEIEKAQMDPEYTGKNTFTMVLQQVQRDSNGTIIACPYQEGMEYKLYDKVTGKEVAVKDPKTNAQGEISMTDGQYAILELPMELEWAVSENERRSSNFDLTKVDPQKGEGLLRKLDATEQNSLKDNPILSQKAVLINAKGRTTVLTWEDVENGVCGESLSGKVTIPQYIIRNGVEYEVVGIGDNAFADKGEITEVEFPPNLRTIGYSAFAECRNLEKVELPDSVSEIREEAFRDCEKLDSVRLSESLTHIKREVFYGCTELRGVVFPSNLQIIGEGAFAECRSLENVTLPDSVTEIGENAFYKCSGLKEVVVSSNSHLQTIGNYAFLDCRSLENVTLPDSVTEIGEGAFYECSGLKEVVVSSNSHLQIIGNYAFAYCSTLDNVELPDSVTEIGGSAFELCEALTVIRLPDGLTYLSDYLFNGCLSLKKIEIPENVTEIGNGTFNACHALETADIPDRVTRIGEYAFYWCEALKKIELPAGLKEIGMYAFNGCSSVETIQLPEGLREIGEAAFAECIGLQSVEVSGSLTRIPDGAFISCQNLKTVIILEGVREIGANAFGGCENLESVELPEGLQTINNMAFARSERLNTLYIPNSVRNIQSNALYTGGLTEVWIYDPSGRYIAEDAFANPDDMGAVPYELTLYVGAWAKGKEDQLQFNNWRGVNVTVVVKENWTEPTNPPIPSTPAEAQNTATRNNR